MSRTRVAVAVVLGVLVALFGGRWLAVRYTEALWYADLGQAAQFRRLLAQRVLWQGLVFLAATLWFGVHLGAVHLSIGSVHLPRRIGNLEIAEAVRFLLLRMKLVVEPSGAVPHGGDEKACRLERASHKAAAATTQPATRSTK